MERPVAKIDASASDAVDVLVVGAGPVGLMAALELKRYGMAVRIVDCAPKPTDKSKALVVWSRTLEHLQRAGIADRFVQAGHPVKRALLTHKSETLAEIPLDTMESPFPFALMLPQSETERLLAERLAELGVTVERPLTLTKFQAHTTDVDCSLRHADGRAEQVRTTWLLGADGTHSTVRHQLGVAFEGDTLPSDWLLADVHLQGNIADGIDIHLHEDGVLVTFPISSGRYRVIANVTLPPEVTAQMRADGATLREPMLDDVRALLARRDRRVMVSDPVWLAYFHINERIVPSFVHGHVLLAGDAAHIHSPAGGQGMNTGMQDSVNLAWKLAILHSGAARADILLPSYDQERLAVGHSVLRNAGVLTRIATVRSHPLQWVRNVLLHLVMGQGAADRAFAENLSELALAYPKSPLTAAASHTLSPGAGERAPLRHHDATFRRPVSSGDQPRFTLFAEGGEAGELLGRFPLLLEASLQPPFSPDGIWLVRPDGYVSVATRSLPDVEKFLRNLNGTEQPSR